MPEFGRSDIAALDTSGWTGRDAQGRQQCLKCWKWQFPAIHSCPGVPQRGATAPRGAGQPDA